MRFIVYIEVKDNNCTSDGDNKWNCVVTLCTLIESEGVKCE